MSEDEPARPANVDTVETAPQEPVPMATGEPVVCPRCRAENPPGTIACLACGADVSAPQASEAPPLIEEEEYPPPRALTYPYARPFRPRTAASSGRLSGLALLALAATAALLFIFFLAPSTTITLVPERQVVSETVQVLASPAVRVMDVEKRQIPGRVLSYEVSGSDQVPLTKQKEVLTGRAQGMVIFANRGDQSVLVPKGTVVSNANSSARYETTEEVLVPGQVFGTAKVGIRALTEGPAGNTEKLTVGRIEGSLGTLLYAANDAPVAGGDKRMITYVTSEDRAKLRETLLAKLKDEAYAKLQVRIQQGEFVAPESMRLVSVAEEVYDKAVNEEANVLGLKMKVSFSGIFVDGQKANDLALQALNKKVKPGFTLLPQSVQLTPKEVQRVEGDTVYFLMYAQGTSVASFDEARIRQELNGKSQAEAQQYLESLPNQAERPKVEISPGWLGRVARLDFRIYINSAPKSPF